MMFLLLDQSIFEVANVVLTKDPGAKLNNAGMFKNETSIIYECVPLFISQLWCYNSSFVIVAFK